MQRERGGKIEIVMLSYNSLIMLSRVSMPISSCAMYKQQTLSLQRITTFGRTNANPGRCAYPQTDARSRCTMESYDNVLPINAIHRFSPSERLLHCAKRTWPYALHVPIGPLVIVLPHALKHLKTTEVVEERALSLHLDAAVSNNSSVVGVEALCT